LLGTTHVSRHQKGKTRKVKPIFTGAMNAINLKDFPEVKMEKENYRGSG